MDRRPHLAAVVLAAGAGSRFSDEPGAKLMAQHEGQPMLARVLGAVRAFGPAVTVVVLGHGAEAIERSLDWRDELRIRNHAPDRGLASSLQVGIDALRALPTVFDGAFIVLGDQPRLRADVLQALAVTAAVSPAVDRPVLVPRYAHSAARNPVLLLRAAWTWVDEIEGDHGLAALIDSRPDAVEEVPVEGSMPDVDSPADLAGLERD